METARVLAKEQKPIAMVARGSAVESFVGLGAAVVAILALIGVLPITLLCIATIALGAAFVIESGAVIRRAAYIFHETGEAGREWAASMGGLTIESIGGLAGISLGILALIGLPDILLPIALISMGGAAIFASGTISMTNSLIAQAHGRNEAVKSVAHTLGVASADLRILAGLAGIALGILAINRVAPLSLTIIGILALGGVLFFETLSYSSGRRSFRNTTGGWGLLEPAAVRAGSPPDRL
jgi:hypothetical protein